METIVVRDKYSQLIVFHQSVSQKPLARPATDFIAHHAHGNMYFFATSACNDAVEYRRGFSERSNPKTGLALIQWARGVPYRR
ncbi:MAG: hypothetical protein GPOALKHO_001317 [Sodalis sp.]|nr:MAG: hypothetical protein GPOALKHO_001317 [Sodalis sp.]